MSQVLGCSSMSCLGILLQKFWFSFQSHISRKHVGIIGVSIGGASSDSQAGRTIFGLRVFLAQVSVSF